MPNEGCRKVCIGKTARLKRKNNTECIERLSHLEAALGLPGPDLRSNVIKELHGTSALDTQAAIEKLEGVFQAASQEMYNASNEQQNASSDQASNADGDDAVAEDVDFEDVEVSEDKK